MPRRCAGAPVLAARMGWAPIGGAAGSVDFFGSKSLQVPAKMIIAGGVSKVHSQQNVVAVLGGFLGLIVIHHSCHPYFPSFRTNPEYDLETVQVIMYNRLVGSKIPSRLFFLIRLSLKIFSVVG